MGWSRRGARNACGHFQNLGIDLESSKSSGGGETMQAVISGSVDIGMNAGTLGVLGAFAKGAPIRIISSQATGDDAYCYARADSPVRSMADMGSGGCACRLQRKLH